MLKRLLIVLLAGLFGTLGIALSEEVPLNEEAEVIPYQGSNYEVIKGTIKEVAEDGTYIIVDDTKISTTKEFLEDSLLETGDKVEIVTEKISGGLKAVDFNYVFDDEAVPFVTDTE